MITVSYNFPLPTCQCGAMLGNGITGITLWGGGNTLNITVGSGNLWDHRGGMPWRPDQNFSAIRKALEAKDMDAIYKMFAPDKTQAELIGSKIRLNPIGFYSEVLGHVINNREKS